MPSFTLRSMNDRIDHQRPLGVYQNITQPSWSLVHSRFLKAHRRYPDTRWETIMETAGPSRSPQTLEGQDRWSEAPFKCTRECCATPTTRPTLAVALRNVRIVSFELSPQSALLA